jgi:dTDP-4-dehydrorhamnose 3,5-epimerase-like enzyme
MMNYSIIQISSISSETGCLFVLEKQERLPFEIKRVYYITNVKNDAQRGNHAHKQLKQLMICLGGSCDIVLDNGVSRTTITLDMPGKILYIQPCLWREIKNFTENATLMVFASEEYDENDYIRDYEEFKKHVGQGII